MILALIDSIGETMPRQLVWCYRPWEVID